MPSKKTPSFNLGGVLNMAVYQKIRNMLKPKSIRSHATEPETEKKSDAQSDLEELLEHAITDKECINLIYKDKLFLAAVPVEEIALIKQLEACLDAKTPKA
ncbi:hypothetical protein BGP_2437 [Beggiatoa sp. PS]|nr:hypothetical protein BGP_2437 [Beggiatoa sp. PS]